jgi:two-component system chemotaxis response regulator CheY
LINYTDRDERQCLYISRGWRSVEEDIMSNVISWLIGIETTAANLYGTAAVAFRADKDFSRFLSKLAEEERDHEKVLQQASAALSENEMKRASFHFDHDFRNKIESPFSRATGLLKDDALSKNAMLDIIAEAEFSEWNEVLIYTLDILNSVEEDIQKFTSDIDQHRLNAQEYIASLPNGESILQRVRRLSRPGGKRVLIVESNRSVARMLEALAGERAKVVIASNGQEGISQIRQGTFDLIVSETELPMMNGIEMYKQALETDPSLSGKFVFFTGTECREYLEFVRTSKVLLLPKPSPVKLVCEMMNNILDSTSVPHDATIH